MRHCRGTRLTRLRFGYFGIYSSLMAIPPFQPPCLCFQPPPFILHILLFLHFYICETRLAHLFAVQDDLPAPTFLHSPKPPHSTVDFSTISFDPCPDPLFRFSIKTPPLLEGETWLGFDFRGASPRRKTYSGHFLAGQSITSFQDLRQQIRQYFFIAASFPPL